MSIFSFIKSVYALDNLDTRFTTPSSVPYTAARESRIGDNGRKESIRKPSPNAQPSKWATPEFRFYCLVILLAVPSMFWIACDVSRRR